MIYFLIPNFTKDLSEFPAWVQYLIAGVADNLSLQIKIINTVNLETLFIKHKIHSSDTIFIPHVKFIEYLKNLINLHDIKQKVNLMLFANSTTAMYRHAHYLKLQEECDLYYDRSLNKKYAFINKLIVLTTTIYLRDLLRHTFSTALQFNTYFEFFGYYLPDINLSEHFSNKTNSALILESNSGIKNSDFLLYALHKFYVLGKIVVVGDNYKSYNNFIFIDRLKQADFIKRLKETKYFITASIRDTLNYSLIEAYLCKCRVIFPKSPIYDEIFNEGNKYGYDPFNSDHLIKTIVCNDALYELKLNFNNCNPSLIAERFEKIRQEILDE